MALLGRSRATVGLDIGSGLIKLVVITHGGSGPTLTKVAFTQVVDDAIVEGEVMDPAIVADAIRGLFASSGVPKHVVTAVGGRDAAATAAWPRARRRRRTARRRRSDRSSAPRRSTPS